MAKSELIFCMFIYSLSFERRKVIHITCLAIGSYGLHGQIPKKEPAPHESTENLVKPTENNVFCPAKKKDKPGNPTVIQKPRKTLAKSTFSAPWRDGPSRSNRVAPRGKPWGLL